MATLVSRFIRYCQISIEIHLQWSSMLYRVLYLTGEMCMLYTLIQNITCIMNLRIIL